MFIEQLIKPAYFEALISSDKITIKTFSTTKFQGFKFAFLKYKNYLVVSLILLQSALMLYLEVVYSPAIDVKYTLFIDQFSIIMAHIIGIIGGLI